MKTATIVVIGILFVVCQVGAQDLVVAEIVLQGNHKTKNRIVLRELSFEAGDTIPQELLGTHLERSRQNLLNTGLFTGASLNVVLWDTEEDFIIIGVDIAEAWYIYPIPLFELADRNFNVWWNEFDHSLKRVNVGLRLHILNMGGVNDELKLKAQVGFTPKLEITYQIPFINKAQTLGLEVNMLRATNKEIALFNARNKQVFHSLGDRIIFRQRRLRLGMSLRPNLYVSHRMTVTYHDNWLIPELAEGVNPDFFLRQRNRQKFMALDYSFVYDHRDVAIYPTRGWYTSVDVIKEGMGIFDDHNAFFVLPTVERFVHLTDRLSAGVNLSGKLSIARGKQPFNNYRGLGFNNSYIRGYELYVVDGLDFFTAKSTVHYRLFQHRINWKKIMPIKQFRIMPIRLYLSANYDAGYVNDPYYSEQNSLTNQWLYGGGAGLNLMLYNIFLLQVEFSVNHLGEKGIFLHSNTSF